MTHSILEFLRHAIVHYGYWAVAAALLLENIGLPLPGETVLLLASFLAFSEHDLHLRWIIVVATMVATAGGSLGFAVGYHGGRPLVERYQSFFRISTETLARGEGLFARYGAGTIVFARFIFGLRVIAGPLAGVLRMPWRKFLIFNAVGAAFWVTVISTAGYLFGEHWQSLERGLQRFDYAIVIAVILAAGFWWCRRHRRHPESTWKVNGQERRAD